MKNILLMPPIAFLIYFILVALFSGLGRLWAYRGQQTSLKTSTYASGEAAPRRMAAPGYRPYFIVALFFAILHLGALMLGSSDLSLTSGAYLVGLMIALVALILG